MQNIRFLENIIDVFNNIDGKINSEIDYFNIENFNNLKAYESKLITDNNIVLEHEYEYDTYNIWDIIDNIQEQINNLNDVLKKDLNEEYKKAIENNTKENGKREIIESIKEIKTENIEVLEDVAPQDKINLSILSEHRKIVKSSADKIFRIIDNNDTKEISCINKVYLNLNVLNENIKTNKEVEKWDFIENIWSITHDLRRISEYYYNDKRKHNTISKIHDDINNLIYIISPLKENTIDDDIPF